MTNTLLEKKIVGVIGLGSVGWATVHSLSPQYEYCGYDSAGSYVFDSVLAADIIFISVPTPLTAGNRLDCSAVSDVLSRLSIAGYQNCVVVKSTLSVGFMDAAAVSYPNLRLVYMPEFLRERSAFTWCCEPDRLVVSGADADVDEVLSYFTWVPESVPRLRMSWRSAEIGKLAHNAYIATKVSFTNEIEALSQAHAANPADVMHVVWADRRVGSPEHLQPFLGGYGGKCVPKDTKELLNCGGEHPLLNAVETVNNSLPAKEKIESPEKIVTIISTHNRIKFLQAAIDSIVMQRRQPDKVYVVYDSGDPSETCIQELVADFAHVIPISVLINSHEQNLSGAINTALLQAAADYPDTNHVFVSVLDDDDWWDISYLQNVSKFAEETGAEWIISGLIRYDAKHAEGYHQIIPQSLTPEMFYISNPNVQGSNLFVRLSRLIEIGGFDENLVSTTDRDVCIRLLKTGTRYAVLNNHLVHHNADDTRERLSQPGNERKRRGLQAFYRKYADSMTNEQRTAFKVRSKTLFQVDVEDSDA